MRGPSDGYRSGRKRHYRRTIWNALESTPSVGAIPTRDRRVLLLDESGASETMFLVARGYKPSNITLVNINVATAARATLSLRRVGIFGVESRGGDVAEIWKRAADEGRKYDVVHLDFCGYVGPKLRSVLEGFNGMAALGPTAIAVNVLRGRESNDIFGLRVDLVRSSSTMADEEVFDYSRRRSIVGMLCSVGWDDVFVCRQHLLGCRTGTYVSSNGQSFLWVAGELHSHGLAMTYPDHVEWCADTLDYMTDVQKGRRKRSGTDLRCWAAPPCMAVIGGMGHFSVDDQILALDHIINTASTSGNEALFRCGDRQRLLHEHILNRALVDSKWEKQIRKRQEQEIGDPKRQIPERYAHEN